MAHRRKKRRTQALGKTQNATATGVTKTNPADRIPKSMVIRMGASDVGPSVTQLVHDVRAVMEPHTAARLKERRSNKLKDYTTMAGPLGVSHLMLFSRSETGNTNFRIAISPRGPTLTFRVEKYSLCKDIAKSQRRPKHGSNVDHLLPPLLVMNNFTTAQPTEDEDSQSKSADERVPKHLENLTTQVFQSLFPALNPQKTPITSIRRVLLLNRETKASVPEADGKYILQLRHYAIRSRVITNLSKGLKRLRRAEQFAKSNAHRPQPSRSASPGRSAANRHRGLPNLGKLDDVADFILGDGKMDGYMSGSETDVSTDAEVEVLETSARKVESRKAFLARQKEKQKRRQQPTLEDDAEEEPDEDEMDEDGEGDDGPALEDEDPERPKMQPQKRAVKLVELGPRMTLRLIKVEEGLCEGKVMWHEYYQKTDEEVGNLDRVWKQRREERAERKRQQKEAVEAKRKAKAANKGTQAATNGKDEDAESEEDEEFWSDDDDDEDGDKVMDEAGGPDEEAEQEFEDDEEEEETDSDAMDEV